MKNWERLVGKAVSIGIDKLLLARENPPSDAKNVRFQAENDSRNFFDIVREITTKNPATNSHHHHRLGGNRGDDADEDEDEEAGGGGGDITRLASSSPAPSSAIDSSLDAEQRREKLLMKTNRRKRTDLVDDGDVYVLCTHGIPHAFIWNLALKKARQGATKQFELRNEGRPREVRPHESVMEAFFLFRYASLRKCLAQVTSSKRSSAVLGSFLHYIILDIFGDSLPQSVFQENSSSGFSTEEAVCAEGSRSRSAPPLPLHPSPPAAVLASRKKEVLGHALDRLAKYYTIFFQYVHDVCMKVMPPPQSRAAVLTPSSASDSILEWYPFLLAHATCESLLVVFPGESVSAVIDRPTQMRVFATSLSLLKGLIPSTSFVLERRLDLFGPVESFEPLPPAIRLFHLKDKSDLKKSQEVKFQEDILEESLEIGDEVNWKEIREKKRKQKVNSKRRAEAHAKDRGSPERLALSGTTAPPRVANHSSQPVGGAQKRWGKVSLLVRSNISSPLSANPPGSPAQDVSAAVPPTSRSSSSASSRFGKSDQKTDVATLSIETPLEEELCKYAKIYKEQNLVSRTAPGFLTQFEIPVSPSVREMVAISREHASRFCKTISCSKPDIRNRLPATSGKPKLKKPAEVTSRQQDGPEIEVITHSRPPSQGIFLTDVPLDLGSAKMLSNAPSGSSSRSGTASPAGKAHVAQSSPGDDSLLRKSTPGWAVTRHFGLVEDYHDFTAAEKAPHDYFSTVTMSPLIGRFLQFPGSVAVLSSSTKSLTAWATANVTSTQSSFDPTAHMTSPALNSAFEKSFSTSGRRQFLRMRFRPEQPKGLLLPIVSGAVEMFKTNRQQQNKPLESVLPRVGTSDSMHSLPCE
eukprot:ANDGO_03451.mRNA.1 hypothetical protein